jgi:nucleoside-diphosphate-sugar epimerase
VIRSVAMTGATGFIGRHAAAALASRGIAVTSIVRPGSRHTPPADSTVVQAPLDAAALRKAFAEMDAVIHLAGVVAAVDARTFFTVNAEGTRAVAAAARDAGARLIHVSSLAAAGPAPASAPSRETDTPRPITPYGASKLESERIVNATEGLRSIILRPGVVYGPTDRAVFPLFQAAQRGILPLVGHIDAAYAFIHVDDVVRAVVAAVEKVDVSGAVFVAHETPVTALDLIDAIQPAVGRPGRVIRIPMAVTRALALAGDVAGWALQKPMPLNSWRYAEMAAEGFVCRVDRMRQDLGIVARVGLKDGMKQTAAWYRAAGWLTSGVTR